MSRGQATLRADLRVRATECRGLAGLRADQEVTLKVAADLGNAERRGLARGFIHMRCGPAVVAGPLRDLIHKVRPGAVVRPFLATWVHELHKAGQYFDHDRFHGHIVARCRAAVRRRRGGDWFVALGKLLGLGLDARLWKQLWLGLVAWLMPGEGGGRWPSDWLWNLNSVRVAVPPSSKINYNYAVRLALASTLPKWHLLIAVAPR